jgi:hypothetical protein
MLGIGKRRPALARVEVSGMVDAPTVRIAGNDTKIILRLDELRRVLFLRIGEALWGAEVAWVVFVREVDAIACQLDCPGLLPMLFGPFGCSLEAAHLLDTADAAATPEPLRRAKAGVAQLDSAALATVLAGSVSTGCGVMVNSLPTIT